jgi:hypothetical protein
MSVGGMSFASTGYLGDDAILENDVGIAGRFATAVY